MHTASPKTELPVHHKNPALLLEKPPPPLSLQYTHLRLGAVLLALDAAAPGTSTPVHAARHDRPSAAPASPNQLLPPGEGVPPPEAPSSHSTPAVRGQALRTSRAQPPPSPPAFPPRARTWAATEPRADSAQRRAKQPRRPKQTWAWRGVPALPAPTPTPPALACYDLELQLLWLAPPAVSTAAEESLRAGSVERWWWRRRCRPPSSRWREGKLEPSGTPAPPAPDDRPLHQAGSCLSDARAPRSRRL